MGKIKFGLNMGPVQADFVKNPVDVLRELSQIGYEGVEIGYPLPLPVGEFNSLAKELDMVPISVHARRPSNDDELKQHIDFAKSVHCERIVLGSGRPDKLQSADDYKTLAELFNKCGEQCKKVAIQVFYHNHHYEFIKHVGKYGMDIFIEETNPEWVNLELDVGWLKVGGVDPVEYIHKNESRCRLIHFKDVKIKGNGYDFTEAGTGDVDFKKIHDIANPQIVDWLISEQDSSTLPPMECVKVNYENFKRLGVT